jgi:hypothetical protein
MANTVAIQSVTNQGNDVGFVSGTVNGIPAQTQFRWSSLGTFASALLVQTYLAQLLVASVPATPINVNTYNGTVTV